MQWQSQMILQGLFTKRLSLKSINHQSKYLTWNNKVLKEATKSRNQTLKNLVNQLKLISMHMISKTLCLKYLKPNEFQLQSRKLIVNLKTHALVSIMLRKD